MAETTWRAHLDKYASETDLILHKKGENFLITVGGEAVSIKAQSCCAGAPYVLPLTMIKEAKMIHNKYAMPSLVLIGEKQVEAPPDEETGEVPVDADGAPKMISEHFFHKFFLEGNEEHIVEACNKVDAQVRLLQGQVLIAGYIDATLPKTYFYFSPEDAVSLFETENTMTTKGVGETKTIYLANGGGAVRFTRKQYGTDVVLAKEDPEFVPSSVFIQIAKEIQFTLSVYKKTVVNNAAEEVEVFRVGDARNLKDTSAETWTVTLEPKVVITAPYLAGLGRKAPGAARPRTKSFTLSKNKK
uniref:Uncharacterized protein n=1 Tax=Calcidiscus leptoporus TaxID=127549 RepID=A0A7S0P2X4_9EUKA|mmetsp:Transcript_53600/g.123212  ORF Transcript_53600/g.123212 Transcript_53600/m.123212 type:complete len:301 (+) Transcript_53600:70-972(+)